MIKSTKVGYFSIEIIKTPYFNSINKILFKEGWYYKETGSQSIVYEITVCYHNSKSSLSMNSKG